MLPTATIRVYPQAIESGGVGRYSLLTLLVPEVQGDRQNALRRLHGDEVQVPFGQINIKIEGIVQRYIHAFVEYAHAETYCGSVTTVVGVGLETRCRFAFIYCKKFFFSKKKIGGIRIRG